MPENWITSHLLDVSLNRVLLSNVSGNELNRQYEETIELVGESVMCCNKSVSPEEITESFILTLPIFFSNSVSVRVLGSFCLANKHRYTMFSLVLSRRCYPLICFAQNSEKIDKLNVFTKLRDNSVSYLLKKKIEFRELLRKSGKYWFEISMSFNSTQKQRELSGRFYISINDTVKYCHKWIAGFHVT